jgi:hypothetical protein
LRLASPGFDYRQEGVGAVLDAYIIEDIKRREEERRRREDAERPRLRIEIDDRPRRRPPDPSDARSPDREPDEETPSDDDGVVRIRMTGLDPSA